MIVASMSTIPIRKETFKQTARSILDEQTCPVDCLHVYLYGYAEIPSDIPQNPRVRYHLEYPTAGPWARYLVADTLQDNDYLVTLDDDMLYPSNYVETGLRELEHLGLKAMACFAGIRWDPLLDHFSYSNDRWQSLPETALDVPHRAALPTGITSFFHASAVRGAIAFPVAGFHTNDDMMIGYALQKREIKIWCCPKPALWIRELETSRAPHALFRKDIKTRHLAFHQMVTRLGFDPTAGRLAEILAKPKRILVLADVCPPLDGSEQLDASLRQLCADDASVHLLASVPASQVGRVQQHVNTPYEIHAVSVPEPGGRFEQMLPVREWRTWRVTQIRRKTWKSRVKIAISMLKPTRVLHYNQAILVPLASH
jgi:hypothetical protein